MKLNRVFGHCLVAMAVLILVGSLIGNVSALSIMAADSSAARAATGSQQPPVPEPQNLLLLGSGLVGMGWLRCRQKRS